MAAAASFRFSLVTPERVIRECDARFVALPAWDGEIGILRRRAPLVCKLDVGLLRVEKADGEKELFLVDGGFAEMVGDRLTVLTESAGGADALDPEATRRELDEARRLEVGDDASFAARQRALKRARVRLRLLDQG